MKPLTVRQPAEGVHAALCRLFDVGATTPWRLSAIADQRPKAKRKRKVRRMKHQFLMVPARSP